MLALHLAQGSTPLAQISGRLPICRAGSCGAKLRRDEPLTRVLNNVGNLLRLYLIDHWKNSD